MHADQARLSVAARRFADRLNRLFDERRAPGGREYTLADVSTGTGGELSVPYLSMLRNGGVAHPRSDKLALLANFFGVDTRYFTALDPDGPLVDASAELEPELRHALENPWTRQFAARASDMGPEDYEALLNFWEYSAPLRRGRRQNDGAPRDDTPATATPQEQEEV